MNREKAIQGIVDWAMQTAMSKFELDDFFAHFSERVRAIGLPVFRLHMAISVLHPTMAAVSLTWRSGVGLSVDNHAYSAQRSDQYVVSPLFAMMEEKLPEIRQSLEVPKSDFRFNLFSDIKDEGGTDYYLFPVMFDENGKAFGGHVSDGGRPDGMLISWVSDAPGGFTQNDITDIHRLTSRFSVVIKLWVREQIAKNVALAYMGTQVGQRVLDGQIKRGDAELIDAVIWYSDLRGSTDMADNQPVGQVMEALDRYFDCTAGAVMDNGGQVLRFIGDAVLAIFPFQKGSTMGTLNAHKNAFNAALQSFDRMKEVNTTRTGEGSEPLSFGLGLHTGELLFGNIGIPERVEFSVIGGAANEVARIEGMTKEQGVPALFTKSFTDHLPTMDWDSQGMHSLRGVSKDIELFTSGELA